VLDGRVDADTLDDIRLLVSELVTNSVRHSGTASGASVRLTVASRGRSVRVEVIDAGRGFDPKPRTKPRDEAGGWGLHLVERIASRWGVTKSRGARVWFEIDGGS
jgi:anti-sigma regulatory factor (Ser/Thr protein kinase)